VRRTKVLVTSATLKAWSHYNTKAWSYDFNTTAPRDTTAREAVIVAYVCGRRLPSVHLLQLCCDFACCGSSWVVYDHFLMSSNLPVALLAVHCTLHATGQSVGVSRRAMPRWLSTMSWLSIQRHVTKHPSTVSHFIADDETNEDEVFMFCYSRGFPAYTGVWGHLHWKNRLCNGYKINIVWAAFCDIHGGRLFPVLRQCWHQLKRFLLIKIWITKAKNAN